MVKNIIQRIIVGIGIALALMFLKGNLIMVANAKSYYSLVPTQGTYAYRWSDYNGNTNATEVANVNYQVEEAYQIPFYLFKPSTSSAIFINNLKMYFLNNGVSGGKSYNAQFIIYLPNNSATPNGIGSDTISVFLRNNDGATFTCEVYNNFTSGTGGTNPTFNNVFCNDVYLPSQTNFYVDVVARGGSRGIAVPVNTFVGMSKVTLIENNDNSSTTQAIQETNNTLKDDSIDENNTSSSIDTMNSQLASNNSITQLLTLPIQLYQSILNSINGSCSSFNLGTLYNHSITLPCINLQSLLGSTLYGIIDILISGLFILSFRKKMVDIFNHMTSLNDRGNEVE